MGTMVLGVVARPASGRRRGRSLCGLKCTGKNLFFNLLRKRHWKLSEVRPVIAWISNILTHKSGLIVWSHTTFFFHGIHGFLFQDSQPPHVLRHSGADVRSHPFYCIQPLMHKFLLLHPFQINLVQSKFKKI